MLMLILEQPYTRVLLTAAVYIFSLVAGETWEELSPAPWSEKKAF